MHLPERKTTAVYMMETRCLEWSHPKHVKLVDSGVYLLAVAKELCHFSGLHNHREALEKDYLSHREEDPRYEATFAFWHEEERMTEEYALELRLMLFAELVHDRIEAYPEGKRPWI